MDKLDAELAIEELCKTLDALLSQVRQVCPRWAPSRAALYAGRTALSHKTCVRHHNHVLQEQRWPLELQQLSWQLSHELALSAKSSPACSSLDCKHWVGPRLSCVPVWLQGGDYHHGHDFYCVPVTGEVTKTGKAALSSLYWADQGVWPREQKGNVPVSQAPRHHRLLPWKHDGYRVLWRNGLSLSHDTLFGIFFSLLLSYTFHASVWPPYPHRNSST